MTTPLLLPAAVLVAWTLVVWAWMLATRVPAMQKARLHPEKAKHTRGGAWNALPSEVRQVADNYNHLMEQPTIFYAIVMVLAVSGEAGMVDVGLAWAYVGLRIIHSLWQATKNVVMIRFYLFVASTLVLFPLAGRAIYLLVS
ncbi:MAG: hypothetical protein CVT79_11070 [Alphaproteobacteria bacterium HGW-Alphaproteobacteria-18]|nr:MAG: hypothetical protein CVT79_11070 [Alphaproteobacteria bacterium HGW-Alphaproteobacteria-18]